jgi:hypothetical protein
VPIITFLQDVFSIAKGPYHHKIGRHTQRFCSKAAKYSGNEMQRKYFLLLRFAQMNLLRPCLE